MCKSIMGHQAQFAETIFLIKHKKNQAQKQGSANQWGATAAAGEVAKMFMVFLQIPVDMERNHRCE